MTLFNAFSEVALEQTMRQILRAVSFARDSADRMRVVVDNQPAVTLQNGSSSTSLANAALTVSHFGNNTWNIIDQREVQTVAAMQNFQLQRDRWTF